MARDIRTNVPANKAEPFKLTLDNWKPGLVTLVDQTVAVPGSVVDSKNMMQVQDGRWKTRWGTQYYGNSLGDTIDGIARYVATDGTSHLVAVVAGTIKRSTDNGNTWTICSGATLTSGKQPYFIQSGTSAKNYLYITNSTGNIVRYDGTTTLVTFTSLTTPVAPTLALGSGLGAGSFNVYYKVTAINEVGETAASTAGTSAITIDRDNWKNDPTAADTQYINLTLTRVTGATRYMIYFAKGANDDFLFLDSIADPGTGTTFTYHDNGKADTTSFIVAPATDSTLGPKIGPMELSGNRIWSTKDHDNPWRVWWSGTFPHMGAFNPYYDGGYIDLELGGAERPQSVVHYRDGKGGSFATVLTADPEGNGSIWQIDLQNIQVGNFSYTQPVPTKIVGSIGTVAPLSVVKVKNDIMFLNRKGFFTLGSKAQMLNLLSTDEISANIRPDIRGLTGSSIQNAAGIFYDAKVFYAVPSGSTTNNAVYVNDTERRNWSGPWTVGVKQFLVYSDTTGSNHLLAVPTTGTQLIEFREDVLGDLGVAFETQLITGLSPVDPRDRRRFAKVMFADIELSHATGNISVSLIGTSRSGSYSTIKSLSVSGPLANAGYDTQPFSSAFFSDDSLVPKVSSDIVTRKYSRIGKKLNMVQFRISTNDLNASYTLLSLQARGFYIDSRDPSSWKV